MQTSSPPRPAVWRALGLGAVLLLLLTVAGIALISSGRLDPQLPGPLQAALGPQTVAVGAEEAVLAWQEAALPEAPASVRLQARSSGAALVAYGLAVGGPDDYLAVMVSPAGYASVLGRQGGGAEEVLLWRPAPGTEGRQEAALQIDASEAGEMTVWVDGQVLWAGAWPAAGRQVGLAARGEGSAATVVFEQVEVFGR